MLCIVKLFTISWHLSKRQSNFSCCGWGNGLQYGEYLRTAWISVGGQQIMRLSSSFVMREMLTYLELLNSRWYTHTHIYIYIYTGCNRRNGPDFGRVFLMLNYTGKPQNTHIQSWTVWEIMASEVWNFDSCYTLTDYQIHIETGRNMWFL